jgi:hypothetical protein
MTLNLRTFKTGISPVAGYFISKKIAVGLAGSVNYTSLKFFGISSGSKSSYTTYLAGPFIRYYQPFSDKFYSYLSGQFYGGFVKSNVGSSQTASYQANFNLGFLYFLNTHWAGEAGMILFNYSYSKPNDINTHSTGFTVGIPNLTLGINYFFR